MPSVPGYDSEQECELWSLISMVCIQGILQVWLRLIFLAGFVMYENPELVFALLMGPYLYDAYLAMMLLSAVILVVIELAPRWYNPWWVRKKKKKLYKYLSRMKLLMILTEYWNADKWKCAPTPFRWGHNGQSKNKSYCPRFYAKTKGGAKVKKREQGPLTIARQFARESEGRSSTRVCRRRPSASQRLGTTPELTTQRSIQYTQSCVT
jgi:uncharacterized membrane protein